MPLDEPGRRPEVGTVEGLAQRALGSDVVGEVSTGGRALEVDVAEVGLLVEMRAGTVEDEETSGLRLSDEVGSLQFRVQAELREQPPVLALGDVEGRSSAALRTAQLGTDVGGIQVEPVGFEPTSSCLQGRRSSIGTMTPVSRLTELGKECPELFLFGGVSSLAR